MALIQMAHKERKIKPVTPIQLLWRHLLSFLIQAPIWELACSFPYILCQYISSLTVWSFGKFVNAPITTRLWCAILQSSYGGGGGGGTNNNTPAKNQKTFFTYFFFFWKNKSQVRLIKQSGHSPAFPSIIDLFNQLFLSVLFFYDLALYYRWHLLFVFKYYKDLSC